jgi:hypothetical protein
MQFADVATELTTGATDAIIAVEAVVCAAALWRRRTADPFKTGIWTWVFGLLAVASVLGAVAHALDISESLRTLLWRPLYLALGVVVALFAVGAVYDWRGRGVAARLLPVALAVGLGFFLVTQMVSGAFLVFVLYEAVAMLAALAIYGALAVQQRRGAGLVATGVLLSIVAAGIQATGSIRFELIVPFDHNGVFHLVQMVALVPLTVGLLRSLGTPSISAGVSC